MGSRPEASGELRKRRTYRPYFRSPLDPRTSRGAYRSRRPRTAPRTLPDARTGRGRSPRAKRARSGPRFSGSRGEPCGSPGRVAEPPVGEAPMSAGLIRSPDLVGKLGVGGADVDGGATGPPVPASHPARRLRKKKRLRRDSDVCEAPSHTIAWPRTDSAASRAPSRRPDPFDVKICSAPSARLPTGGLRSKSSSTTGASSSGKTLQESFT